ncbi:MAG: hypothetical protein IKC89_07615 [Lentisphaeria bacterium]|nr:hypothetical protein [Lentisphaeria bacterium]
MARSKISNYEHSGGFSRLAGHPSAPGSWKPQWYFLCWKVLYILVLGMFLLIGTFYMIF